MDTYVNNSTYIHYYVCSQYILCSYTGVTACIPLAAKKKPELSTKIHTPLNITLVGAHYNHEPHTVTKSGFLYSFLGVFAIQEAKLNYGNLWRWVFPGGVFYFVSQQVLITAIHDISKIISKGKLYKEQQQPATKQACNHVGIPC